MSSAIAIIAPEYSLFHCIKCNVAVSSLEHDCEQKTFIYTKEELAELRKQIEG